MLTAFDGFQFLRVEEQVFIADIRNCQNKEQEKSRVDKELGKIRKKFASGSAITGCPATHMLCRIRYNYASLLKRGLYTVAAQSMIGKSMYGSCCTFTCWATKWNLGINRQRTSFLLPGTCRLGYHLWPTRAQSCPFYCSEPYFVHSGMRKNRLGTWHVPYC